MSTANLWWLGSKEVLSFPAFAMQWSRVGWAAYFSEPVQLADAQVFVRFGRASDIPLSSGMVTKYPLVIRETIIRGTSATAALVRELPFARMEAAANRRLIRVGLQGPSDFPFINDDFNTTAPTHLLKQAWMTQPEWKHEDRPPVLKLRIPPDHKKPDSFYAEVADRYQWLTSQGRRPAEELAAANDVPATTVHRWVKEARRREIMPPGQRARVGES